MQQIRYNLRKKCLNIIAIIRKIFLSNSHHLNKDTSMPWQGLLETQFYHEGQVASSVVGQLYLRTEFP